jgi:hypothetical protein
MMPAHTKEKHMRKALTVILLAVLLMSSATARAETVEYVPKLPLWRYIALRLGLATVSPFIQAGLITATAVELLWWDSGPPVRVANSTDGWNDWLIRRYRANKTESGFTYDAFGYVDSGYFDSYEYKAQLGWRVHSYYWDLPTQQFIEYENQWSEWSGNPCWDEQTTGFAHEEDYGEFVDYFGTPFAESYTRQTDTLITLQALEPHLTKVEVVLEFGGEHWLFGSMYPGYAEWWTTHPVCCYPAGLTIPVDVTPGPADGVEQNNRINYFCVTGYPVSLAQLRRPALIPSRRG